MKCSVNDIQTEYMTGLDSQLISHIVNSYMYIWASTIAPLKFLHSQPLLGPSPHFSLVIDEFPTPEHMHCLVDTLFQKPCWVLCSQIPYQPLELMEHILDGIEQRTVGRQEQILYIISRETLPHFWRPMDLCIIKNQDILFIFICNLLLNKCSHILAVDSSHFDMSLMQFLEAHGCKKAVLIGSIGRLFTMERFSSPDPSFLPVNSVIDPALVNEDAPGGIQIEVQTAVLLTLVQVGFCVRLNIYPLRLLLHESQLPQDLANGGVRCLYPVLLLQDVIDLEDIQLRVVLHDLRHCVCYLLSLVPQVPHAVKILWILIQIVLDQLPIALLEQSHLAICTCLTALEPAAHLPNGIYPLPEHYLQLLQLLEREELYLSGIRTEISLAARYPSGALPFTSSFSLCQTIYILIHILKAIHILVAEQVLIRVGIPKNCNLLFFQQARLHPPFILFYGGFLSILTSIIRQTSDLLPLLLQFRLVSASLWHVFLWHESPMRVL